MKKHLLFLLSAAALLSACRKDRTCTCTVSTVGIVTTTIAASTLGLDTSFVAPLNNSSEQTVEYKKVTKRNAKTLCVDHDDTFSDTYPAGLPGVAAVNITNSGTREYDCKLK